MITSAPNASVPVNGAAPQDAVQGRGGKEKSEDFGNALSSVSQRQSKGQGDSQAGETKADAAPSAEQDADVELATPSARISISGLAVASAVSRMDLTIAGALAPQPTGQGEMLADGKLLPEGEADPTEIHVKSSQPKVKPKTQDETAEDGLVPKQNLATDGKVQNVPRVDVPNTDAEDAQVETVVDGVNSALSFLTGAAEVAVLAHGAGKALSNGNSARVSPEDGKREAAAVQKQSAVGESSSALEPELAVEVPGTESASGEKIFRFASSRGNSMEMIVGTGADGKTTFETSRSGNGSAEQVTVLDSRRFLGFNQSTNGATLTAAMSQDQEWAAAMQPSAALSNAAAQSSTGNVVNTLKLQMTPVDLGSVTATLRLVGEQLSVHLTVETRAAHSQLMSDSSGILEALRSQGFSVDQVTVTITPASQSDNSQQANDPGQRGTMQGQQGNGGQGQGQQSQRPGAPFMTGNDDYETAADPRLGAASGSDARAGDIYL